MKVAILVIWLVAAGLKLTGFCFTAFGWKTDDEIIDAALRLEPQAGRLPANLDPAKIRAAYPRCCGVGRVPEKGDWPFLSAMFLQRWFDVSITIPIEKRSTARTYTHRIHSLVIDCCGTYIRYGERVTYDD